MKIKKYLNEKEEDWVIGGRYWKNIQLKKELKK
jgi:hypothetical protein